MFHPKGRAWAAGVTAAVILLLWSAVAGARPLAQVRLSSLQAVLADVTTVASAAGRPVRGEDLLVQLLEPFGIREFSVLDATRPVVAALPLEGMLLQQRGMVLALPVAASGPLYEALAGGFASRGRDGDLEVFSDAGGPVLYARERDGYVVAGHTRQLVADFDLAGIAVPLDGPPGSVVAELDLEPLAPLIQAGLVGAREKLRQQLAGGLSATPGHPPAESSADPAALAEMLDLYLGAVQAVLADLSRVQLGFEIQGEHLFWHNRVVARPGTATAEFSAHQGGGLPPLGRVVSPGAVNVAGQVKLTPLVHSALAEFLDRYLDLAGPLLTGVAATDPAAELAELGDLLARGLDCFTGEVAAGLGFAGASGLTVTEAVGTVDTPRCRDLTRRSLGLLRTFPAGHDGDALLASAGEETIHGVTAERITVDLGTAAAQLDPKEQRVLRLLYGGPTLTSYIAATGPVTYYTLGGPARANLGAMLEAAGDPGRSGIDAGTFAPLVPGPGMYLSADVPKLLSSGRDLLAEDDPARVRLDQAAKVFEGAKAAGRVVAGLTFDPQGATLQVAMPLRALELGRPVQPLPKRAVEPKE